MTVDTRRDNATPLGSRSSLALVLTDQAMWSGGFFLFNASLGLGAEIDFFAQVATATSISLIFLAIIRAWSVDSLLLFSSGFDACRRGTAINFALSGGAAATTYLAWTFLTTSSPHPSIVALAFAIVFGDNARYARLTAGQPRRSLPLSATYFLGAGIGAVALAYEDALSVLVCILWATVLIVIGSVGLAGRDKGAKSSRSYRARRLGLTLEAFYFVGAGHIGLLALSALALEADVTGMRLAYSVALAPATLIIQGLSSQVVRVTGLHRGSGKGIRFALAWGIVSACLYILNAACLWVLVEASGTPRASIAQPFILPLCAFFVGQSLSNAIHAPWRYHVSIRSSQLVRLTTLAAEIILQVTGVFFYETLGLITAMYVSGCIRLLLGFTMLAWLAGRAVKPVDTR